MTISSELTEQLLLLAIDAAKQVADADREVAELLSAAGRIEVRCDLGMPPMVHIDHVAPDGTVTPAFTAHTISESEMVEAKKSLH